MAPGDGESPSPAPDGGSGSEGTIASGAPLAVSADGPGRITSTPPGIDCGGGGTACTATFTVASVTLATDKATTVRWDGACSGNGDCVVAPGSAVGAETFAAVRTTFDGSDHGSDGCYAIAAGPGDSIVVAGEIARIAQGHDAWARAYDATGAALWTYELSTPSEGHDRGNGVVALPDGGALVAGTWFSGSNTHWNSFAVEIAPTGAAAWSQINEIVGDDRYSAVARDAAGRVFLAGARPDTTGQLQAWLRALPSEGSAGWEVLRAGSATGVALDAGDVIAVGSETTTATGLDGWIARYAPDGAPRWSVPLASPGVDAIAGVAAGADGIAIVGMRDGAGTIAAYTADGAPRWDATAADGATWNGVAVDAAGDVVVAGTIGGNLVARKYSPTGALIWQRAIEGARGQAVAVDAHGNVLVCGAITTAGNTDALIVTFPQ